MPSTVPHPPLPARHAQGHALMARQFLGISLAVAVTAIAIGWSMSRLLGRSRPGPGEIVFPGAFWFSTIVLGCGSWALHRAEWFVSQERQAEFRRQLRWALGAGTLFTGVQSYALWAMFPQSPSPEDAALGVTPFMLMLAGLHALHFFVAVLFLALILIRAHHDRYDHEYHWGVTCCAWFWHFLGIVWAAVLAVFSIVL